MTTYWWYNMLLILMVIPSYFICGRYVEQKWSTFRKLDKFFLKIIYTSLLWWIYIAYDLFTISWRIGCPEYCWMLNIFLWVFLIGVISVFYIVLIVRWVFNQTNIVPHIQAISPGWFDERDRRLLRWNTYYFIFSFLIFIYGGIHLWYTASDEAIWWLFISLWANIPTLSILFSIMFLWKKNFSWANLIYPFAIISFIFIKLPLLDIAWPLFFIFVITDPIMFLWFFFYYSRLRKKYQF